MEAHHFDRLVLTLTHARTRRSVLGLLGALGLTGLLSEEARATHTPGDCLHTGVRCLRSTDCCSGRCVRKRGTNKKFCRQAPGQSICTIELDSCAGTGIGCDESGAGDCQCFVTSRGFSFCSSGGPCFACETDADCVQRPGGKLGERCVQCPSACGPGHNERACHAKCPDPA